MKLKDALPLSYSGGGVFSNMIAPPWGSSIDSSQLDIMLISEYGERTVSPMIENLVSNIPLLSKVLLSRFSVQWKKKFFTLSIEYDPIENYKFTENETNSVDGSHTENNTKTLSDTINQTATADIDSSTYGFNSVEPTPDGKSIGTNTQTATNTHSDNESVSHTDKNTNTRKLTRNGNIGVTTNQRMIDSEIKLWEWCFVEDVLKDSVSLLTIQMYEN